MNDITTEKQMLNWIQSIQEGKVELFNQLLKLFEQDIKKRINVLNISHEEREDIAQTIRYNLYKQALTFDVRKKQSFSHCANVIIKNAKIDYIRKLKSEKYRLNATPYRLDGHQQDEDCCLGNLICESKEQTIEDYIFIENFLSNLLKQNKLNNFEVNVVKYTLHGKTKKEISNELNVPIKHIYNAQYRIKTKLNKEEITSALFDN
nr:sigma factor [Mammaliicoccus sp. Marseille-Q6498]